MPQAVYDLNRCMIELLFVSFMPENRFISVSWKSLLMVLGHTKLDSFGVDLTEGLMPMNAQQIICQAWCHVGHQNAYPRQIS